MTWLLMIMYQIRKESNCSFPLPLVVLIFSYLFLQNSNSLHIVLRYEFLKLCSPDMNWKTPSSNDIYIFFKLLTFQSFWCIKSVLQSESQRLSSTEKLCSVLGSSSKLFLTYCFQKTHIHTKPTWHRHSNINLHNRT